MVSQDELDQIIADLNKIVNKYWEYIYNLGKIADIELLDVLQYIKESRIKLTMVLWLMSETEQNTRDFFRVWVENINHSIVILENKVEKEIDYRSIKMMDGMKTAVNEMQNEIDKVDNRISTIYDKIIIDLEEGVEFIGAKGRSYTDRLRDTLSLDITGIWTTITSITVILWDPFKLIDLIGDALGTVW